MGVEPNAVSEGALQNPDWFTGRFGFIPTNTLSHIIAVSLFDKIEQDHSDALDKIKNGDLSFITSWLTENIFSKGRSINAVEVAEELTGKALSSDTLLAHFENRYIDGTR